MKKIFLTIGFLSIFLSSSNIALAAENCSWTKAYSSINGGNTTWSCPGLTSVNSNDSKCSGTNPSTLTDKQLCCCTPTTTVTPEKPTVFEMADLQVEIPGMNKLASVVCKPGEECAIPWIGEYTKGIYNYLIAIVGVVAALVLMAGGVLWLVSRGEASKITQAKELILGSVVGTIILACSYLVLLQLNPNLVNLQNVNIKAVKAIEIKLAESRLGNDSQSYKAASCASNDELSKGIDFYATGYYKPKWENTDKFRCVVAMQCTCPNGQDTSKNCDFLYGKLYKGYHPCKEFTASTPYCNMTSSGAAPKDGDVAGPSNCKGNLPSGTKVCFKGKTYTITDSGGGIKGRRIDIWSGDNIDKALSSTGVGKLTIGACK